MSANYIMNCPVVDSELPVDFRKALNAITDHPVIKPTIRTNGITAGKSGKCYWNASYASQTWGGEMVFGWLIDRLYANGGYTLLGHACWLNPEGELVDVTDTMTGKDPNSYIGFLPLVGKKLQINGKKIETLNNYYYPTTHDQFCCATLCASEHYFPIIDKHKGKDNGFYHPNNFEVSNWLGKLLKISLAPNSFLVLWRDLLKKKYGYDLATELIFGGFGLAVDEVTASTSHVETTDPAIKWEKVLRRVVETGKSAYDLFPNLDFGYEYHSGKYPQDIAWDLGFMDGRGLPNASRATGKTITEIPPKAVLVESHTLPKSNGARKKLERLASKYNLTPQEVLLLSNPYHYPHPYLVKKANGRKVERVQFGKQTKCFGSV